METPTTHTKTKASPKPANHIMIDLETMGTEINSPILAIGACEFCPLTKQTGSSIYLLINLQSNMQLGRMPSAGTIYWWLQQAPAAQQEMIKSEKANDLKYMLQCFKNWIDTRCLESDSRAVVWGNSASFDISMIKNAMQQCNVDIPWEFWDEQCYRTLKTHNKHIPFKRLGNHHNALHDATNQAKHAAAILNWQLNAILDYEAGKPEGKASGNKGVLVQGHVL